MKIPKHIDYALKMRTSYAQKLDKYCSIIDNFMDQNNIEAEMCDYHGGVELYVNPEDSEANIRAAIIEH